MTYEEAFNLLVRKSCRCKDESKSECDKCSVAYDMIEHIVLEAEKYRWHDLRKNPNDLPSEKGEYIVAFHPCYWENVYSNVEVGMDSFRGKKLSKVKYQRVIAWREIETYEVTE